MAETSQLAQQFLGLTRNEADGLASELGRPLRIIDEQTDAITADLWPTRINAYVKGGRVIGADAG